MIALIATRPKHLASRALVVAGTLGLSALAGACATTPRSDIEGEEDAFFGSLRVSVPFRRGDPGAVRFGVRVEGEATRTDFDQELAAGQVVQLEDVPFSGPGEVEVEFEHVFAGLGLYAEGAAGAFEWQGTLGVGGSFLDGELSMAGVSESSSLDAWGPFVDTSVAWRFAPPLTLYYGLFGHVSGSEDTDVFAVQLGVTWTVARFLGLSAGLQSWDYSADRDEDVSDIEVSLDGPFVRLDVRL